MAWSRMVVVVVVLAMLAMGETAESPPNCDSAASTLLPCYPYVTGPDVKPPSDCCGGLSGLNTNSPTCLCQLITQLNGSAAADPTVNITKAFNLPKDCAITLKTSDCPALANLPLAPPAGVTPTPGSPLTASPGPTAAAGPGVPGNDVSKLLPTSLMIGVALAAGVVVQALIFI
ncbi:hypothetical protein KC19_2G276500 [Ceratodon purpureus]|uniref:Bifunctional inhibitor/plant lipid transfer protein/seed storage helical domain-containing protein n=1 Tax=Ceratodon purpureus TaxID=3225 RepID=A0A8T0J1K4_CERPU|nr:hypothetical protein KC19_2G276500 [Ceratodon purpureus]